MKTVQNRLTTYKNKNRLKMSAKVIFSIIAGYAGAFLTPITSYLIAVFVLVCCDQLSGTWAAIKRGETLSSSAMWRTVEKIVFYLMAILLSEMMRKIFFPGIGEAVAALPATFIVASFISFREFWSVLENISDITGIDIVGALSDKIRPLMKKEESENKKN